MARRVFVIVATLATGIIVGTSPAALRAAGIPGTIPGLGLVDSVTGATQGLTAVSADGNLIVFWSSSTLAGTETVEGDNDVYMYNRATQATTLISKSSGGGETNGESRDASISNDGRYVAFISINSDIVAGDTNNAPDAFVTDTQTLTTVRASVADTGAQIAGGIAFGERIYLSGDGRHVAFTTADASVTAGDINNVNDVFVRDLNTGHTLAVSVDSTGAVGDSGSAAAGISADGRIVVAVTAATTFFAGDGSTNAVAFDRDSDANGTFEQTGVTAEQANIGMDGLSTGYPNFVDLSGDGHHVAFQGNGQTLVRDLATTIAPATTVQADVTDAGIAADGTPYYSTAISDNGAVVTFYSGATNLGASGGTFAHDRDSDHDGILDETGATTTTLVSDTALFVSLNGPGTVIFDYYTGTYADVIPEPTTPGSGTGGARVPGPIYFEHSPTGSNTEIWRVDANGANLVRVTTYTGVADTVPAVSPDGTRLAYMHGTQIMVLALTRTGPAPGAMSVPVGTPVADGSLPIAWSPTGDRIAASVALPGGGLALAAINVASGQRTAITNGPLDFDPAWAPNGTVAFDRVVANNRDIWITDTNAANPTPLVATDQLEMHPAWSHDGTRLAYINNTTIEVRTMATAATVHTIVDVWVFAWSPDDASFAYVLDDGAGIYTKAIAGTGPATRLTVGADGNPAWSSTPGTTTPTDGDGDGIVDTTDNCPTVPNPTQTDTDGDGHGDACDPVIPPPPPPADGDGDGVSNTVDNCPGRPNADQKDTDGDGYGDVCDLFDGTIGTGDGDGDGIPNNIDNCPGMPNPAQNDTDGDGYGDVCDGTTTTVLPADQDHDGVPNSVDNCPGIANPAPQTDRDGDGIGDPCDRTDGRVGPAGDNDGDGIINNVDNCPGRANTNQADSDHDGIGDVCDTPGDTGNPNDLDFDGIINRNDNCRGIANPDQADRDHDGIGDVCDDNNGTRVGGDNDGDNVINQSDNCPGVRNPDQTDRDHDGVGDACDNFTGDGPTGDNDGDGVTNQSDNCPGVTNRGQTDKDHDGIGDACDPTDNTPGPGGDQDGDGTLNGIDNCPAIANPDQTDRDGDGRGDECDTTIGGDGGGGDNDPRQASDGYFIEEGQTLSIPARGVLENDSPTYQTRAQLATSTTPPSTLSWTGDGSFTFVAPQVSADTSYDVTYRGIAADGSRSRPVPVVIRVMDSDRAPVAVDDAYTMHFGEKFQVPAPGPLGNDSDPDGTRPTQFQVVSTTPTGIQAGFSTDGLTFTASCPAATPCTLGQTIRIQYRTFDDSGFPSNIATITIAVVGNQPGIQPDTYTVKASTSPLRIDAPGPLANDLCRHGYCTGLRAVRTAISFAAGELQSFNADGSFAISAGQAQVGTRTITYRALDVNNVISGTALITIRVVANANPVAASNAIQANNNTVRCMLGYGVLGNDTDPDGPTPIRATLVSTSFARGEITWNGDGTFCLTIGGGAVARTFTYRAVDADGGISAAVKVTINIVARNVVPNQPPAAKGENYYAPAGEATVFPHFLNNDTDPENAALRMSIVSTTMPPFAAILSGGANGSFTMKAPPLQWIGRSFTFNYSVIDPEGRRAFATATIHIDPPPTVCDQLTVNATGLGALMLVDGTIKHCWDKRSSNVVVAPRFEATVDAEIALALSLTPAGMVSVEPDAQFPPTKIGPADDPLGGPITSNTVDVKAKFTTCISITGTLLALAGPLIKGLSKLVELAAIGLKFGLRKGIELALRAAKFVFKWIVDKWQALNQRVDPTEVAVAFTLAGYEWDKVGFDISVLDDMLETLHDADQICMLPAWSPHLTVQTGSNGEYALIAENERTGTFSSINFERLSTTYAHPKIGPVP